MSTRLSEHDRLGDGLPRDGSAAGRLGRRLVLVSIGPAENGFRRYWLSLAITTLGTWAGAVALSVRLFDETGSAVYASLLFAAEFAPTVFIGLLLGRLLDRVPPVGGLAAIEAVAAATWLVLVFVHAPWAVIALAFLNGACAGAYKIVATSAVSLLVGDEHLDAANAAALSVDNIMTMLGYAIGGFLLGLWSADGVLGLNAVTFAASSLLLLTVPRIAAPASRGGEDGEGWWRRSTAAARRMWRRPALRVILVALPITTIALGTVNALEIPYLRGEASMSETVIGVALASLAAGIVVGAWAAPSLPPTAWTFATALVVLGLGWCIVAATTSIGPILVANALSGFANGVVIIRFRSTMQRETEASVRASTIAFIYALTFGCGVLGAVAAGAVAEAIGIRETILAGGLVFAASGLVAAAVHVASSGPAARA